MERQPAGPEAHVHHLVAQHVEPDHPGDGGRQEHGARIEVGHRHGQGRASEPGQLDRAGKLRLHETGLLRLGLGELGLRLAGVDDEVARDPHHLGRRNQHAALQPAGRFAGPRGGRADGGEDQGEGERSHRSSIAKLGLDGDMRPSQRPTA